MTELINATAGSTCHTEDGKVRGVQVFLQECDLSRGSTAKPLSVVVFCLCGVFVSLWRFCIFVAFVLLCLSHKLLVDVLLFEDQ